jgi:hypothetical protein
VASSLGGDDDDAEQGSDGEGDGEGDTEEVPTAKAGARLRKKNKLQAQGYKDFTGKEVSSCKCTTHRHCYGHVKCYMQAVATIKQQPHNCV